MKMMNIRYGLPVVLAAVVVAIAWQNRPAVVDVRGVSHDPVVRAENRQAGVASAAASKDETGVTTMPSPTASVVKEESPKAPLLSREVLSDPRRTREGLLSMPMAEFRTIVGTKTLDRYVARAMQFDPDNETEEDAAMQFLEQLNERILAANKS